MLVLCIIKLLYILLPLKQLLLCYCLFLIVYIDLLLSIGDRNIIDFVASLFFVYVSSVSSYNIIVNIDVITFL